MISIYHCWALWSLKFFVNEEMILYLNNFSSYNFTVNTIMEFIPSFIYSSSLLVEQ